MPQTQRRRIRLTAQVLPFVAFHLVAPLLAWQVGLTWEFVALCLGSYVLRMFGVTAGYHRYFSHRSFRAGRIVQFVLAFLAQTASQKGVIWWAAHHRHHHWHSDKVSDVHSPSRHGFFYSHIGWVLSDDWDGYDASRVRDLTRFPELVWLDRFWVIPPIVYGLATYLAFGFGGFVWGFLVSTLLVWHGTFCINSLSHVFGRRMYATSDTSKNNALLALITLGEGWHNNHHHFQRSTAQGWRWYELDITYLVLKAASVVGIVQGVSRPPAHVVAKTIDNAVLAEHDATLQEERGALEAKADALAEALRSLRERAESASLELRDIRDRTTSSAQATLDEFKRSGLERRESLRESAERLRHRAENLAREIRERRDRTLENLQQRADELSQSAAELFAETSSTAGP